MAFSLTPVSASGFVDRKTITKELVNELASRNKIGFSISGVRRIGKTSVLKEVQRLLVEDHGIPVVYVSVWRVSPNTVDEFVRVVNRAILLAFEDKLPAKFKFEELLATGAKALGRFLLNLKLSAKVSEDLELSISYVRRESNDVDAAIAGSFSLVEHLAGMTKTKCVLMIDEFPSLVELTYGSKNQKIGDSIIKLMRTLYEDFRFTKLVISGSYRETLKNLVGKQQAPFYKQLLIREVKPFAEPEFEEFIKHYLPDLNFADEAGKKELQRISSGIPYNLQLLGKEIQSEGLRQIDMKRLRKVVMQILEKEGEPAFGEFVEDLTPSEVKVIKSLARSQSIKPSEIAAREFMDDDTVNSSLNLLVRRGILARKARGVYEFIDNLFAEWLKNYDIL